LALLEQADPGPWRTIVGMIADLLTVRREYAPLIDLALGDWAQRFLVRDAGTLAEALQQRGPFSGRVSFLPLTPPSRTETSGPRNALRANRLIELSPLGRVRMPASPEGTPAWSPRQNSWSRAATPTWLTCLPSSWDGPSSFAT
jgi:hypothetical protein